MFYDHAQEARDYEEGYNPQDRFAGFDRGDSGRTEEVDELPISRVVGRMTNGAGQRVVLLIWTGADVEDYAEVQVDGGTVYGDFDPAKARDVAKWWMAGCPA